LRISFTRELARIAEPICLDRMGGQGRVRRSGPHRSLAKRGPKAQLFFLTSLKL